MSKVAGVTASEVWIISKRRGIWHWLKLVFNITIISSGFFAAADALCAEQQQIAFDIRSKDLSSALIEFSEQSDIVFIAPRELISGKTATPVKGLMVPSEALEILLKDSGLMAVINDQGVLIIKDSESGHDAAITKNKGEKAVKKKSSKSNSLFSTVSAIFTGFLAMGSAVPNTAYAQTTLLEEVIVTATKRQQTIQEVPFSINAQTEQDIQRSGATSLEDLSRNVAGLTVQNLGPGQSQVAIRGISAGQIIRDQPGVKEQVGIYLDESVISLSLFTPDLDLFDLNRVETLRGPQGTLFGSGSIGGTIRYITNQPDLEEFAGSLDLNVNTVSDGSEGGHFKGAVNIPLADGKAAVRLVGYHTEYAGFIDALGENGARNEDVNDGSRSGGRIALVYKPTDNITISPRVVYQEIDMDGFNRQEVYNLFSNPFTTTRPAIQLREREQHLLLEEGFSDETLIADATIQVNFSGFDVTSVTSYTDRDILVSRDASALTGSVSVDLGFPDAGVLLQSNLLDKTRVEQITQEIRFSSNSDSRWQWVVGGFYSDTERKYSQDLPTPGYDAFLDATLGAGTSTGAANGVAAVDSPFASRLPYDLRQFAFFGEVSFDVTDRLQLIAGGRYYDHEEERTISSGGFFANGDSNVPDETSSSGFTPRFMLSYDMNEQITLVAQASQGFKLGGVNDPLNPGLCSAAELIDFGGFQKYEDETLWNYEGGIKARWDKVTLNIAGFFADISDLQVNLDAGGCSSRVAVNVKDAHSVGVEFELNALPTDNLSLSLAGSVLESTFDSTIISAVTNAPLSGIDDGNRIASVPEFQFAATATYDFPFMGYDAYVSATIQHIGTRFTQSGDQAPGAGNFVSGLPFGGATGNEVTVLDLELDSYQTINLSAGIVKDTWEAVLYANNVTDENANLSFDRERGGRARLGFRTNQPRSVGLTFRKNF